MNKDNVEELDLLKEPDLPLGPCHRLHSTYQLFDYSAAQHSRGYGIRLIEVTAVGVSIGEIRDLV